MTEREALLAAMLKQPEDRTARLVYADWLDEHPELPAATATAEFIRVACAATKKNARMPKAGYSWLRENWRRLIPSVVAISVPITSPSARWPEVPEGGMWAEVKGQELDTYVTASGSLWHGGERLYSCRLRVRFERGLAVAWTMPSAFGRQHVEPELKADQPQLFLGKTNKDPWAYHLPDYHAEAADTPPGSGTWTTREPAFGEGIL